jgi:hypothetical protein
MLLILAGTLSVTPAVAQNHAGSPNNGVIYGTVTSQDGLPAKGLFLNAEPLGGTLGMALPWTKTNSTGAFRFEHLSLGRYTVFASQIHVTDPYRPTIYCVPGPCGIASPSERGSAPAKLTFRPLSLTTASP